MSHAGGRLVSTTSTNSLVVGHAVREPDGSLAVLVQNDDPSATQQVQLTLQGYTAAADATILRFNNGASDITTSHVLQCGLVSVPPSSLALVILPH